MRTDDAPCRGGLTLCVCCAAALIACAGVHAADTTEARQCFHVTFLSLQPQGSIADSRLCLLDNGTLQLSIAEEPIMAIETSYSLNGVRFSGTIEFERTGSPCRYRLDLSGVSLMGRWVVGQATLREFVRKDRLTQRLPFLFLAAPRDAPGTAPGLPVPLP